MEQITKNKNFTHFSDIWHEVCTSLIIKTPNKASTLILLISETTKMKFRVEK